MASETAPTDYGAGKRVLIAGPPYRGYTRTVARAVERCGASVTVIEWDLLRKNLVQDTMFYSSPRYRQRLAEEQFRRNTRDLEAAILRTKPTHVLVMMAARLSDATARYCRENGVPLVMWAYDSAKAYPVISEAAHAYDLVYTYEPTEVESLGRLAKTAFLPMAYDDEVYRPDSAAHRTHDLCFIGSFREVPARKTVLRTLAEGIPEAKVGAWTDGVHWYSPRRLRDWRLRRGRPNLEVNAGTLSHKEINGIYNRSRVCLNIHMAQSVGAPNPRNFEILGSGGVLLTDRDLSMLDGLGEGKGYVRYSDTTSMVEKARELIGDEDLRSRTGADGHSIAATRHTYVHRARRILEDMSRL